MRGCHAIGRSGTSPNKNSPPLRRVAHKYRDKSISSILIIDGTVVEHKGMPRFEISVEQADGLIAYIRSLDRRRKSSDHFSRSQTSSFLLPTGRRMTRSEP